jgi:hypothetical protein
LTIKQAWLGWKYNFFQAPDRGRLFLNVGLIGVSMIDFTMDSLVRVNSPDLSFASVSSTEAEGVAFTSRVGIGGEYFIAPWLSFGVNANYVIGSNSHMKVKRHFRSSFFNIPAPPPETINLQNVPGTPQNGQTLTFDEVQTQNITDICSTPGTLPNDGGLNPDTCASGPGTQAGHPLEIELNGFQVTAALRFYF